MNADITPATARDVVGQLRDGSVPIDYVQLFSAGREGWIRSLQQDLSDVAEGSRRVRLINGRYGDGKTHLLSIMRAHALHHGVATALVTVSPVVRLSRWDEIYSEFMRALHTRSTHKGGFAEILNPLRLDAAAADTFRSATESLRSTPGVNPSFAAAVYRFATGQGISIDRDDDMLVVRNWLEGESVAAGVRSRLGLYAKIDRSNAQEMFRSAVVTLRHYGLRGVLLLLDEVESTLDQPRQSRDDAYDTLRSLVDKNELPDGTMVMASVTPEMFSDTAKGMPSLVPLWTRVRPPAEGTISFNASTVDLPKTPLDKSHYDEIANSILQLHEVAFGWKTETAATRDYVSAASAIAATASGLVMAPARVFVRLMIDHFDKTNSDPAYRPDLRRLPLEFESLANKLAAQRSARTWN